MMFVYLNINSVNLAPTANAGPDITASATSEYTLPNGAASASDPDGTIASLSWVQMSGPSTAIITNDNTLTPTFSGLMSGQYVFQLTATDDKGATASDTFTLILDYNPIATGFYVGEDVIVQEQPAMSGYYVGEEIEVNQ